MQYKKCILFYLFYLFASVISENPVVRTDVGEIKGLKADDGDYFMFLGIPFGQVDKDNPFGPAAPYPAFEDTFEAYNETAMCPQRNEYTNILTGSLDCLIMNIYVPFSASSRNRLPVLVYFYGGSFQEGSHSRFHYGPRFLVKHEIILVTINYRGGPYGFMCLDIPQVPGNQGFKDQATGLRWVKQHISAFGGDADKITISGGSAGSMAVDAHVHSNTEKLFDQVILQSGTLLSPYWQEPLREVPLLLANYFGFPTNSIDEALQLLAKKDTLLVTNAAENLEIMNSFKLCIEKEFDGVEGFLTQNWITSPVPKIFKVPVLIGITNDEQCAYHTSKKEKYFHKIFKSSLALAFDVTAKEFEGMEDIVRNFYFGDNPIDGSARRGICDFDSDIKFVHPTYRTINKYLENDAGNIYLFMLSYVGGRNFIRDWWNITFGETVHGDELGYLFDISVQKDIPISSEDQRIIDQLTKIYANFVKFGKPVPQPTDLLPVTWSPITKKSPMHYLDLGSELKMKTRPFHERTAFWDLFYKTNKHLQIVYPSAKVNLTHEVKKTKKYDKTEL